MKILMLNDTKNPITSQEPQPARVIDDKTVAADVRQDGLTTTAWLPSAESMNRWNEARGLGQAEYAAGTVAEMAPPATGMKAVDAKGVTWVPARTAPSVPS